MKNIFKFMLFTSLLITLVISISCYDINYVDEPSESEKIELTVDDSSEIITDSFETTKSEGETCGRRDGGEERIETSSEIRDSTVISGNKSCVMRTTTKIYRVVHQYIVLENKCDIQPGGEWRCGCVLDYVQTVFVRNETETTKQEINCCDRRPCTTNSCVTCSTDNCVQ